MTPSLHIRDVVPDDADGVCRVINPIIEAAACTVRADNAAALSAYQAFGFGVVGTARRHARLGGRYIDELFIERAL